MKPKKQNTSVTIRLHRYRYLVASKKPEQTITDRLDQILANSENQLRKRLKAQSENVLTKES
jgi:hypothetical protein